MRQKIDLGSGLIAIGAIVLVVSLFLDWYAPALTAFDAFEVVDWLLAGLALLVLGGLATALRDAAPPPRWLGGAVLVAVLLVAAMIIDPPPAAHGQEREVGAWLALGAAALMGLGLALSAASISISVDVSGRERRRRVPAVDRREGAAPVPPRNVPPSSPPPPAAARPPRSDPERTQPLRPLEPRPPSPEGTAE